MDVAPRLEGLALTSTGEPITVRIVGETLEGFVASDGRVTIEGGGDIVVTPLGGVEYRVTTDGVSRRAVVAYTPTAVWVFMGGGTYRVEVSRGRVRSRGERAHQDTLSAPMPARVVKVVAQSGMSVLRGDVLLLLEAMKMEMPLRAPADGRVAVVHCREGDMVEPGVTLVEFE